MILIPFIFFNHGISSYDLFKMMMENNKNVSKLLADTILKNFLPKK